MAAMTKNKIKKRNVCVLVLTWIYLNASSTSFQFPYLPVPCRPSLTDALTSLRFVLVTRVNEFMFSVTFFQTPNCAEWFIHYVPPSVNLQSISSLWDSTPKILNYISQISRLKMIWHDILSHYFCKVQIHLEIEGTFQKVVAQKEMS